jgi:transcriptional regulator with XRE-family HTH domain
MEDAMNRNGKMKPPGVRFGEYFAKLRKSRGVYQRNLAWKLGLRNKRSAQAVSNWETGLALPTPEKLPRIRKILELTRGEYNTLYSLYDDEKRRRDRDKAFSGKLRKETEGELERLELYKAPLYGPKNTVNPVDFIGKHREWKGKTINLPPDLQGGHVFAFKVEDTAMAPRYNPGNLLFCDLNLVLEEGKPVVACVKGQVFCRIYETQGKEARFKAWDPKVKVVSVLKRNVQWLYRVSRRESDER